MKQLVLNAETLLYAVAYSGADAIFGVRNVIAGMGPKDFPALKERAEDELLRTGAAEMDFDGGFTLTDDVVKMLQVCTSPVKTVCMDARCRGRQQHFTFFAGEKEAVAMQDIGQDRYQLTGCVPDEIDVRILQLLPLPEHNAFTNNYTIESGVLSNHNIQELMEQGCDESTAKLIVDALNGEDLFCSLRVINGDQEQAELFFAANDDGILQIGLDYSNEREDVTFTPVEKEKLVSSIASAICL